MKGRAQSHAERPLCQPEGLDADQPRTPRCKAALGASSGNSACTVVPQWKISAEMVSGTGTGVAAGESVASTFSGIGNSIA